MSGASFDGLEAVARPVESEHYAPGERNPLSEIVSFVADNYLAADSFSIIELMDLSEDIVSRLPAQERDVEPNAVLDALISHVIVAGEQGHLAGLGILLDELIRHYYSQGHNGFLVDMMRAGTGPSAFLSHVHGEAERPLRLRYKGKGYLHDFAPSVSNCDLVFGGSAFQVGYYAQHTSIEVLGECSHAGFLATDCSLFVPSLYQVPNHTGTYPHSTRCRFHVGLPLDEDILGKVATRYFYEHGNTLLVPDPDSPGSWTEVRP